MLRLVCELRRWAEIAICIYRVSDKIYDTLAPTEKVHYFEHIRLKGIEGYKRLLKETKDLADKNDH